MSFMARHRRAIFMDFRRKGAVRSREQTEQALRAGAILPLPRRTSRRGIELPAGKHQNRRVAVQGCCQRLGPLDAQVDAPILNA